MNRERILRKIITTDLLHKYISKAYFAKYPGSRIYWEHRYQDGKTSGAGSCGRLAEFKADTLETVIEEHDVDSVIEFGCGDGNQLSTIEYPEYIGLDVSPTAVEMCIERFNGDSSKSFFLYDSGAFRDNHGVYEAELGVSLDVIFHLTEDDAYHRYMDHLFSSAQRYVIVYSSNRTAAAESPDHITHRKFTDWTAEHADSWSLIQKIDNRYPYDPSAPESTSWSDFYIFEKQ